MRSTIVTNRRNEAVGASPGLAAWVVVAATLGAAACSLVTPFEVRADADADSDADSDGDPRDGDGDTTVDDREAGPGPLVLVGEHVSVSTELVCDVNGDGHLDNAVAALGAANASLFAMAFSALVNSAHASDRQLIFHFQWIQDLSGPSTPGATVTAYGGRDTDLPPDSSDDYDGAEPFYVNGVFLDGCGEPLELVEGVVLDDGVLSGGAGVFSEPFAGMRVSFSIASMSGTIAPWGDTFELLQCGVIAARELGGGARFFSETLNLTLLEVGLSGGASFGLETVPGLEMDVDLDGDGLERIILDDENHIESCVDGDFTVIDGNDCWQDPRMADGFSLTLRVEGTSARYGGRAPGWGYMVPQGCASFPVERGFFSTVMPEDGPCAAEGERCDPDLAVPCCDDTLRCSGGDLHAYRCHAQCEPSPCDYGTRLSTCRHDVAVDRSVCFPIGTTPAEAHCEQEDEGCTTEYGISGDTICVERPAGDGTAPYCVELCPSPEAPCGDGMWCVPLAFEDRVGACTAVPWSFDD